MTRRTLDDLRQKRPVDRDHPAYRAAKLAFELGVQVRELREQRGWSQAELGRRAGMTQSAVARFEAGGTVPTLDVLERIATAFGAHLQVQLTAA
ncbi:hypothetical protein GCM10012275_62510 [Longimycelium tulufanense]|uniref:HTH cro/C1-type domain-containing protein n=1 Tax=Longimycelium tulufanense TaxID=907463 RepID=A0A8J3FZC3_9PSEU|nr:helix-turn-helix transcriptional regulator [Longimycelium tulufanense]GGM83383.1 hypothetical protein GCM10012275_62510 [Longimycelium tulufanense]